MSSVIDWSKAPADAEYAGTCRGIQEQVFYKNVEEYSYDFIYPNSGPWDTNEGRPSCQPLIPRPANNAEWSDEGLPPVGARVSIIDPHEDLVYGHGEEGEVIAHVEDTAVVRMSYGLGCFQAGNLVPIKTVEQIEKEEVASILRWLMIIHQAKGMGGIAKDLHAEGYRKPKPE